MGQSITPEMRDLRIEVYEGGKDAGLQLTRRSDWGDGSAGFLVPALEATRYDTATPLHGTLASGPLNRQFLH